MPRFSRLLAPAISACLGVLALPAAQVHACGTLTCTHHHPIDFNPTPLSLEPVASDPAPLNQNAVASSGGLNIVLNAGSQLQSNAAALAAFERAAANWESVIGDEITVYINADLDNTLASNVIGSASSATATGPYSSIRNALVTDAANETDDRIVLYLPNASGLRFPSDQIDLPNGFSAASSVALNRANAKAIGLISPTSTTSDGSITFNSNFSFDFDNSNGVSGGQIDFETVATHEIGHILGFVSEVDVLDQNLRTSAFLRPVDFFRFENNTANDPETEEQFQNADRYLQPGGDAIFDGVTRLFEVESEFRLSTGTVSGDGRQASHFKDDAITGTNLGVMDPTISRQTITPIRNADLRVYDLIGYEIAFSVLGDYDADGLLTVADIEALYDQVGTSVPSTDERFDLIGDGVITADDASFWLSDLLNTTFADTDLDQDVDTLDLTTIITNFTGVGGTGQGFADGDTDLDQDVDILDLNRAASLFTGDGGSALITTNTLTDGSDVLSESPPELLQSTFEAPSLIYDPDTGELVLTTGDEGLLAFALAGEGVFTSASDLGLLLELGLVDATTDLLGFVSTSLGAGVGLDPFSSLSLGALLPTGLDLDELNALFDELRFATASGGGSLALIAIPEPGTLALLTLAGGLVARRRR